MPGKRFFLLFLIAVSLGGCAHHLRFVYQDSASVRDLLAAYRPAYPETMFLVMSDPHFYDTALGVEGAAFAEYLANDRKLLKESRSLLETAIGLMDKINADFVLVPGDLTKDGEKHNHLQMAGYLSQLKARGKKVFVVPGNHDIQNTDSFRYSGDGAERIPSVTPNEFREIYSAFGFNEAFERDPASLSYAIEPVTGLWLLGLDACLYRENKGGEEPVVNGRFQAETLSWLERLLLRSVEERKAVIVMMHHGVLEHFKSQDKYFGDYLVDFHEDVAALLADFKVRLVFTGHFHAQDVTLRQNEKNPDAFLFDVETGSLVTAPCPFRIVTILPENKMKIESRFIDSIPSHPEGFRAYANRYVAEGISQTAFKTLEKYWVPREDAQKLAPQIVAAFAAHYQGDEKLPPGQEVLTEKGLSLMGGIVVGNRKELIHELWNDLPPPDNDLTIDLATGEFR